MFWDNCSCAKLYQLALTMPFITTKEIVPKGIYKLQTIYRHREVIILIYQRKKIISLSVKLLVFFLIAVLMLENMPALNAMPQVAASNANLPAQYSITFNEKGLPSGTLWTVEVIMNNSGNISYGSRNSTIEFSEPNGSYNYVVLSSSSYVTPEASGSLNVSGLPLTFVINFQRTAVSEYYQPYTPLNVSQERTFSLSSQPGPSALDFGVMNTTLNILVYNGTGLVYYENITGQPTNFNTTTTTKGYGYVNFQSSSIITVQVTDVGHSSGYFALDLWNYYISNSSASLITLPPHFQEIFGTGTLNRNIGTFLVKNNTGMSFTLVAPYYNEAVPLSIWIGEGYYNLETGKYWWAQLGFDNVRNGTYDVSYGGWGVFSNYASTPGGVDTNFPLVPNQTYTFTMQSVANGSWEFLINGLPVTESGTAFYDAPTAFANGNAYLGVEVSLYSSLNEVYPGSIVIPNVESFRVNGSWERATNVSFLNGERDWEDGHYGTVAGMNLFGVEGNLQNRSIPQGEMIINKGPYTPYEVPSGVSYDVYPISGNFSFPWQNVSRYGKFVDVTSETNGTLLIVPQHPNTEVFVVRFENSSSYVYSDQDMIISQPVYVANPAMDFRAAIYAVPLNSSTSSFRYDGIYQEIALGPILPTPSKGVSTFSLGNSSTSYSGEVYVPVYLNGAPSLTNLEQVYSYDPSLLKFNGTLSVPSSEYVSFSYSNLSSGVMELSATGSFTIVSPQTLLFYLVFQPILREQVSTQILLDSSVINGFIISGNSSSRITLAEGWRSIGPSDISIPGSNMTSGGMISDVAYSPYDMNILYAAAGQSYPFAGPNGYPGDTGFGGILRSTDGGKTWTVENLGLTSTAITAIAVNPSNPNIVVVESRGLNGGDPVGGAIFKTINGGESWEETYDLGGFDLQYLNGTLYATTFYSLLKSTNFGTTWTTMANFSQIVTSSLVLDNGSRIYVGLWSLSTNVTDQILESTDYGASFKLLQNFTQSEFDGKEPSISQIIAKPSNSSIMWALISSPYIRGNGHGLGNPSLYSSSDGGRTWEQVNTTQLGMGYLPEPPSYISYDPTNGSILYVVGNGYIFRSTDGGVSFTGLTPPSTSLFTDELNVDPLNSSILFLCSETGLYRSFDSGKTWVQISDAQTNLLLQLAVDNQSIFAVGEGTNPLYSNNLGNSWTTNTKGYLGVVAVDPYNSSIVIIWTETHTTVGGPFFFVSNNGGTSFFLPDINFTAEVNPSVENIAFSRNEIFVPGGDGIFISTDGGSSWSLIKNSPANASTVVDSPSDQSILYAANGSGLFVSQDNGILWNKVNTAYFGSLAVDPSNSSIIAATTLYGSPYTYRAVISYNGGKTFDYLGLSSEEYELSFASIYFQEIGGKLELVFISDEGIYLSGNMGSTWTNVSYNLPSTLINSFFSSGNGTSYVATYGSGIYVDPQLFNLSFHENAPILTGYLGAGNNVTVDGSLIRGPGYFSLRLSAGNNSINWEGEKLNLYAMNGNVYFINFSNMQVHLTITGENLPAGTEWNISANGNIYAIKGTSTIILPPFTSGIYVYPFATEYSIYYPSKTFYPIKSSLFPSISINFTQKEETSNSNITSKVSGIMWDAGSVYNDGYILYYGQGLGLYDVKDGSFVPINSQIRGYFRSAVSFGSGFVLGGSNDGSGGILGFYNLTDMSLENMTGLMPQTWQHMPLGTITSVTASSSSIYIALAASGHNYLGEISGTRFTNLTSYIHLYQYNGGEDGLAIDYIEGLDAIAFSTYWNQGFLGILYLSNLTADNLTAMLPQGIEIGNVMSTSSAVLSSGQYSFDIIATGQNGTGYVGIFYYSGNSFLHTALWLPYFSPSSTDWDGHDYIVSGQWSDGDSYVVAVGSGSKVSYIPTGITGSGTMINSATSINYSRFALVYYYNGSYFNDYYSMVSANPVSTVRGFVSPNNGSLYIDGIQGGITNSEYSFPVFSGNTTISYSSPGYVTDSRQIYSPPFSTTWENISLNTAPTKLYQIVFIGNGLSSGTSWSVTLNGTTESSTTNDIIFSEPNGTYPYSLSIPQGYTASNSSGTIILNGRNITQTVIFVSNTTATYTIIFTESGLPSSTLWSVTLNGTMKSSTANSITFTEPYGTYSFSITLPSGYKTTTSGGEITTTQSSTNVPINVSPISKTTTPPATTNYLLIGVIVVIIAAIGAVIAMRRRRNKGRKPDKLQEPPSQLPPKG